MKEETPSGERSHERPHITLRLRLLLAFLGLALVPLFGSNAIGYLRSRTILEEQARQNLLAVAELQASHVQERIDQSLLYLGAIASGNRFLQAAGERAAGATSVMTEAATPDEVEYYLGRKLAESERFDGLALFDPSGQLLASTDPGHPVSLWPPSARAAVALQRTGGSETPPTLRFTSPVAADGVDAVAYLAATVPLERGVEFLEVPEHVAGSIESFIVDDRGWPIFVSHPHGHLEYDRRLESPLTRLPVGFTRRYHDREGVEVLGTSAALEHYGWRFVTEVPVTEVVGELHSLRSLSLILGGIFAPLVMVVAWILAGGIVAPIRDLVGAARHLGTGDLSVRVDSDSSDEVGELATAFNDMAGELERSQLRIQRLHDQEIERAAQLATVGELASGLAHEIKNPVVGISNGLDLVLRKVGGDTELKPITAEMKRQLKRIEAAVRDLLAYARPPEPEVAPTSLNQVLDRALSLVEPGAARRSVRIERSMEEDLPTVLGDGELLGQALTNLLINAVEFSPGGGVVQVSTRSADGRVHVAIRDHGPGIPADEMERIFKPFYTTRHSGTGLGLPISRGIAERHGGELRVESRPGEGCTFEVVLPVEGAPARPGSRGGEG